MTALAYRPGPVENVQQAGVDAGLLDVLHRTRTVGERSHVEVFEATDRVGQSTLTAFEAAEEWLMRQSTEGEEAPAENPPV